MTTKKNQEQRLRDKKNYRAPKLTEYGDVRKLTQSGGSGSSDFSGPSAMAPQHGESGM